MEDYKPNSYKSREAQSQNTEEKKKVEKVVSGKAIPKKKTEMQKLASSVFAEDWAKVKDYTLKEVLIPTISEGLYTVITSALSMLLLGGKGRISKGTGASKMNYQGYYNRPTERQTSTKTRNSYAYDDVVVENRGEAEEVLDRMYDILETYKMVSIADLYELVGFDVQYTDNKYGWTDLRNAGVERVRDGYLIKLPKASPLD